MSETGTEAPVASGGEHKQLSPEIPYTREEVIQTYDSVFAEMKAAVENGGSEYDKWRVIALEDARQKIDLDAGIDTFEQTFDDNGRPGISYAQKEGIPVDLAIEFLNEKLKALPEESPDRAAIQEKIKILFDNSKGYEKQHPTSGEYHPTTNAQYFARLQLEANLLHAYDREKNPLQKDQDRNHWQTGDERDNWFFGEHLIKQRRELVLPKGLGKPKDSDNLPPLPWDPKPKKQEDITDDDKEKKKQKEKKEDNEDDDEKEKLEPPKNLPPAPQPPTIQGLAFDFAVVDRTSELDHQAAKEASDYAIQRSEELRGLSPRKIFKRIHFRLAEEYYKQRDRQRLRDAKLSSGNVFASLDLSVRHATAVADTNIAAERAAGEAAVERVNLLASSEEKREGVNIVSLEADQNDSPEVAANKQQLREIFMTNIIKPMYEGGPSPLLSRDIDMVDPEQGQKDIQEALRLIVEQNQGNPLVAELFGANASEFGRRAEYFASNMIETGRRMKEYYTNSHDHALQNIDSLVKIRLANMNWASETRVNFNNVDRVVAFMQRGRVRGYFLNPAVVGATASFLTLASRAATSQTLHHLLVPGVGVITGSSLAALRRNRDLKINRASDQRARAYGEKRQADDRQRERLEEYQYSMLSVDQLLNADGSTVVRDADSVSGVEMRGLNVLLRELNLSDSNDQQLLFKRIAEIDTRLDLSTRNKADFISFESREQVEQGRLALEKALIEAKQALRDAQVSDQDITTGIHSFRDEWITRLNTNQVDRDRAFRNYRIGQSLRAGGRAGASGLALGLIGAGALSAINHSGIGLNDIPGAESFINNAARGATRAVNTVADMTAVDEVANVGVAINNATGEVASTIVDRTRIDEVAQAAARGASDIANRVEGTASNIANSAYDRVENVAGDARDGAQAVANRVDAAINNPEYADLHPLDEVQSRVQKIGNDFDTTSDHIRGAFGNGSSADASSHADAAASEALSKAGGKGFESSLQDFSTGPDIDDFKQLHDTGGDLTLSSGLKVHVEAGTGHATLTDLSGNQITGPDITVGDNGIIHVEGPVPPSLQDQLPQGFSIHEGNPVVTEGTTLYTPTDKDIVQHINGVEIRIPEGTHLVPDPTDPTKFDLMTNAQNGQPDVLLVDNVNVGADGIVHYDSLGPNVDPAHLQFKDNVGNTETTTISRPTLGPDGEWSKYQTSISGREFYLNNTEVSDGAELQVHNWIEGDKVVLDASSMQNITQDGLNPPTLDIQQLIHNPAPGEQAGFEFVILDQDQKLPIFIPVDNQGQLVLDPNSTDPATKFVAQYLLDHDKINEYGNGSLESDATNRQDVFKLMGKDGRMGVIDFVRRVQNPDGTSTHQVIGTIRGSGAVPENVDITTTTTQTYWNFDVTQEISTPGRSHPTYDIVPPDHVELPPPTNPPVPPPVPPPTPPPSGEGLFDDFPPIIAFPNAPRYALKPTIKPESTTGDQQPSGQGKPGDDTNDTPAEQRVGSSGNADDSIISAPEANDATAMTDAVTLDMVLSNPLVAENEEFKQLVQNAYNNRGLENSRTNNAYVFNHSALSGDSEEVRTLYRQVETLLHAPVTTTA